MNITDLLVAGWDYLPRALRRALDYLLVLAMITGVATPLVVWWVHRYSDELTMDVQPAFERLLDFPTAPVIP